MDKVVARKPVEPDPGQSRYAAVAEALRQRIVNGEWPPGTAMPSETSLASDHGVALGTLRQALALLSEQGLIERRHGKGTFVRSGLAGAPMLRFFRFGAGDGASPDVARRLGVGRGEPVLRLQRLRSLAGQPRLLEDIWLPLPLFDALVDVPVADIGNLLYPFFEATCGVAVARATDEIGFAMLTAAQAKSLDLQAGHPCAVVSRQAYDLAGRCVELRITHGDAFAFHYSVTIT
jgi:GntR family transcriptional regulator